MHESCREAVFKHSLYERERTGSAVLCFSTDALLRPCPFAVDVTIAPVHPCNPQLSPSRYMRCLAGLFTSCVRLQQLQFGWAPAGSEKCRPLFMRTRCTSRLPTTLLVAVGLCRHALLSQQTNMPCSHCAVKISSGLVPRSRSSSRNSCDACGLIASSFSEESVVPCICFCVPFGDLKRQYVNSGATHRASLPFCGCRRQSG